MRLMIMMISNNNHHNNVRLSTVHAWLLGVSGCCYSDLIGFWSSNSRTSRKPCNFVEVSNEIACPAGCKGPTRRKLSSYLQTTKNCLLFLELFARSCNTLLWQGMGIELEIWASTWPWNAARSKICGYFVRLVLFHFVSDPGDIQLTAVLAYCPACHLTFDAHLWNFISTSQIRGPENHHATLQQTWRNTVVREENFPVAIGCGQLCGGEEDRTPFCS